MMVAKDRSQRSECIFSPDKSSNSSTLIVIIGAASSRPAISHA